jgi:glucosamine 6-phosphate synthetase-like amidotransferase/phosphosugar isomerase protein
MSISLGLNKNLQMKDAKNLIEKLGELPALLEKQLQDTQNIRNISKKYSQYKNFFFL